MEHKHKQFEIITRYFKDKPAEVVSATCTGCRESNIKVLELFQEHEDKAFATFGDKSPVTWLNDIPSRVYRRLEDVDNPNIKRGLKS